MCRCIRVRKYTTDEYVRTDHEKNDGGGRDKILEKKELDKRSNE